jgi:oligoribonuclease NrnB/cAMP/cGMP phosphodiesterase (DHH superfamily)
MKVCVKKMSEELSFSHLCMTPDEVDCVIFHHPCTDGFGSCFSAQHYLSKLRKEINYYGTTFNKPPPNVTGKNVLICDFSYKKEVMKELLATCNKVVVLDHHKSSEIELQDFPHENKVFRMDHSGAYLTWKFFNREGTVPKMIRYIQDHDLWTKKLYKTDEVSAYMYSLPFTYDAYMPLLDDDYIDKAVIPMGVGMVQQNNAYIESTLKSMVPTFMEIRGMYYFISYLNSTHLKSEVGNKAFEKYPHSNFSAIYSVSDSSTAFSLRSMNDRTDVSEIAKGYNGGGHRNSAGLKIDLITSILPCRLIDNKSYTLLNNIYFEKINDFNIVYLNSSYHKKELGTYLLQTRCIIDNVKIQECSSIDKNRSNLTEYNIITYDISAIWNYDGSMNQTWYTICVNTLELIPTLEVMFNKLQNYKLTENKFVFSLDGIQSKITI